MTNEQKKLTEENLYLAPMMIATLTHTAYHLSITDREELIQIASLALCNAAIKYDPERTNNFKNFAQVVIRNAIYSYWRHIAKEKELLCFFNELPEDDSNESLKLPDTAPKTEQKINTLLTDSYLDELEKKSCEKLRRGIAALRLKEEGYSSADLAQIYRVTPNSIRAWQSQARKALRDDKGLYALLV